MRQAHSATLRAIESERGLKDLSRRFSELPQTDRTWVRDWLIYVVHTFSRRDCKIYTPLVSTTPDFKRAKYFAKTGSKRSDDPCVICLFLATAHSNRVLRSNGLASASKRLKELGFPTINRLFFKENEVAFFGAVYPQFVFAIIDLNSKAAFWNPAVLDAALDIGADMWTRGLPIDQQDFERHLGELTGYARGIEGGATGEREIRP